MSADEKEIETVWCENLSNNPLHGKPNAALEVSGRQERLRPSFSLVSKANDIDLGRYQCLRYDIWTGRA